MRSGRRGVRAGVLALVIACAGLPGAGPAPAAESEAGDAGPTPWPRPPINLEGGYTLDQGQVVLSYRFEQQSFHELQTGRDRVSVGDVLDQGFTAAPRSIQADRHVFGALWAPFDELTFQLELPFVVTKADRVYRPNGTDDESFETKTNGFGDVMLWVLYRVYRDEIASLHLNFGLSFPSGSITQIQDTPLTGDGVFEPLPYDLQLGSGTVDLEPGFTYRGRFDRLHWGFQALATLRAGSNKLDYTLGNDYRVTGYGAWRWNDWLEQSFSLEWQQLFEGTGEDASLDPTRTPLNDTDLLPHRRLDALFGVALTPTGGRFDRTRWVVQAGLPAYQDLDGPQPRTRWLIHFVAELTFD